MSCAILIWAHNGQNLHFAELRQKYVYKTRPSAPKRFFKFVKHIHQRGETVRLCQTDLSLGERRNRKCRSIQLRVGLVRNNCVFFWKFVISTFIQQFTKPLFIKYLNLRQFLLSSLGDNCVILYKAISCDVGTTLNC